MARDRIGSPVEHYVARHLRAAPGEVVVYLHADTSALVLGALQAAPAPRVYVTHRRLPVVQALRRAQGIAGNHAVMISHGHGAAALPAGLVAAHVVIRLPHEKTAFHQLLRDAVGLLRDGGDCFVLGGTTEGIRSAATLLGDVFGTVRVPAHSGGHRLLAATRSAALDTALVSTLAAPWHDPDVYREYTVTLRGETFVCSTRPGVFSWDGLDEASGVFADVMDIPRGASVLDLGCGAGVLGAVAARLTDDGPVTLVDADSEAVRSATRTMAMSGARNWRVFASDVTSAVRDERFDLVISNPPFHTGKATDLALPIRFIEEAADVLQRGGRLQLVANRTLPYERELERVFGNRRTVHDGARFKVLEATRR